MSGRSVQLDYKSNFKNTSALMIENFYRTAGKDFWITRENNLPFGGVNHSGMGSYHGQFGFKALPH